MILLRRAKLALDRAQPSLYPQFNTVPSSDLGLGAGA